MAEAGRAGARLAGLAVDVLLAGAAAGVAGAAGFRLSGRTVRWSSAAIAFTPYAPPVAAALAATAARRGRPVSAGVLAAGALVTAAVVAPRAVPSRRAGRTFRGAGGFPDAAPARSAGPASPGSPGGPGRTLRVMSSNVFKGKADPAALMALVREHQPDVLALQEQDAGFVRALDAAGLADVFPHRVLGSGSRLSDGAWFARDPLSALATDLPRVYVGAQLRPADGGAAVPLLCVHPLPPSSPRFAGRWARSLAAFPAPIDRFAGAVVAGDFNSTLDHPQLRRILALGWLDAAATLGQGLRPTWTGMLVLAITIDHVLAPPGAVVLDYGVHRLKGSDHRTIVATLRLPGVA